MDDHNYDVFEHYECEGQLSFEDCFKDYIEADKDKEQHGADDIPPIFINRRSKKR